MCCLFTRVQIVRRVTKHKTHMSRTLEWVSDCCLTPIQQFSAISWREQVNFQWDDDEVCFVLDQQAELDFYSASSLKQQFVGKHVTPLRHIILIPSQPVFALSPYRCVFGGEATNTNFIVFGLTRPWLEPTIYHTWGEHANHYTTNIKRQRLLVHIMY